MSPEQLQAFEEATQTVLAYRQTIVDLYSGARDNLDDLYLVATGDLVATDLRNIQAGLLAGASGKPVGAQLQLISAAPLKVNLDASPRQVLVRACVDATAVTGVSEDGVETPGKREKSDYTLVESGHDKGSGWLVKRVQGESDPEDRTC